MSKSSHMQVRHCTPCYSNLTSGDISLAYNRQDKGNNLSCTTTFNVPCLLVHVSGILCTPTARIHAHLVHSASLNVFCSVFECLMACLFRDAARAKGVDEFVKHVNSRASDPAIANQTQCILQRWHDLDTAGETSAVSSSDTDSQADDDPEGLHADLGDHLDEAESIHIHGGCDYSCIAFVDQYTEPPCPPDSSYAQYFP